MSIENGQRKSPYRGVWVVCLFLILIPLISCLIVKWIVFKYQAHQPYDTNMQAVKTIGCGVGLLFHLSCIIIGILKEPFRAIISRVGEFFANVTVSVKLAFSCYWEEVKYNGVVFWIYFAIIATNFGFFLDGLLDFLKVYLQ